MVVKEYPEALKSLTEPSGRRRAWHVLLEAAAHPVAVLASFTHIRDRPGVVYVYCDSCKSAPLFCMTARSTQLKSPSGLRRTFASPTRVLGKPVHFRLGARGQTGARGICLPSFQTASFHHQALDK
jgi:hypothetical protein